MKDHHYILTSNSSVNKSHLSVEQRHNQTQIAILCKNNMPLHSPETSSLTMTMTSVTQHHNIGVNIKPQIERKEERTIKTKETTERTWIHMRMCFFVHFLQLCQGIKMFVLGCSHMFMLTLTTWLSSTLFGVGDTDWATGDTEGGMRRVASSGDGSVKASISVPPSFSAPFRLMSRILCRVCFGFERWEALPATE